MLYLQLILNGVQAGLIYALTAAGFSMIFGMTRVFHAAHGATFIIAAYAYYHFVVLLGLPWFIAAIGSAVAAVGFGVGLFQFVYRRIQEGEQSFFTVFIASFGALIVVQSCIAIIYGSSFTTVSTELSKASEVMPGLYLSPLIWITILLALACFGAMGFLLSRTSLGIAIRALADDPENVRVYGMNPDRLSIYVFAIGSLLTVPGAIITTVSYGVSPSIGEHIVMISLAATIVGGIGSLTGAAIAGLILGVAENVALIFVGPQWSAMITFILLVFIIIVRPSGIARRVVQD